jgi:hypothetical protein
MLSHPSTCGRKCYVVPSPVEGKSLSSLQLWEGNALSYLYMLEGMFSHPSTYGRDCSLIPSTMVGIALLSLHLQLGEMLSHPINLWEGRLSHPSTYGEGMLSHLSTYGRERSQVPPPMGGIVLKSLHLGEGMLCHPSTMGGSVLKSLHLGEGMLSLIPSSMGGNALSFPDGMTSHSSTNRH